MFYRFLVWRFYIVVKFIRKDFMFSVLYMYYFKIFSSTLLLYLELIFLMFF